MSGFINDKESLANGVPARHVSPETGSFGNAIETNRGGTSEGTNEAYDSVPPPDAAIGESSLATSDADEERPVTEGYRRDTDTGLPVTDEETVAQQIADGGDHFVHGKTLHDHDKAHDHDKKHHDR